MFFSIVIWTSNKKIKKKKILHFYYSILKKSNNKNKNDIAKINLLFDIHFYLFYSTLEKSNKCENQHYNRRKNILLLLSDAYFHLSYSIPEKYIKTIFDINCKLFY